MASSTATPRSSIAKILVWTAIAALLIGGLISFFANILSFLDPTLPILSFYIFLFGAFLLASNMGLQFARTYFGFLNDWLGEAIFFIFTGTLGISFGTSGLVAFIVGLYATVVGFVLIGDHFLAGRGGDAAEPPATVEPTR